MQKTRKSLQTQHVGRGVLMITANEGREGWMNEEGKGMEREGKRRQGGRWSVDSHDHH